MDAPCFRSRNRDGSRDFTLLWIGKFVMMGPSYPRSERTP